MKTRIRLLQNEYSDDPHHEIPCPGSPAIFVMDSSWCIAPAADSEEKRYIVIWDAPQPSGKPDWSAPRRILCGGEDVTENVILEL